MTGDRCRVTGFRVPRSKFRVRQPCQIDGFFRPVLVGRRLSRDFRFKARTNWAQIAPLYRAIYTGRRWRPISSLTIDGDLKKVDKDTKDCKPGFGGVVLAFLTGAGVAATAILVAQKVKAPSAERLLAKCDRALEALDCQVTQSAA